MNRHSNRNSRKKLPRARKQPEEKAIEIDDARIEAGKSKTPFVGKLVLVSTIILGVLVSGLYWFQAGDNTTIISSGQTSSGSSVNPDENSEVRLLWQIPARAKFPNTERADEKIEAFEIAETLVLEIPNELKGVNILANLHQRFRNEEGAVSLWRQCLDVDPKFTPAMIALAELAEAKGEFREAEVLLRQAIRADEDSSKVMFLLAGILVKLGNATEAVELLNTLLVEDTANVEAWAILGRAYQLENEFEEANRSYSEALARDPFHRESLLGIANLLRVNGQAELATEYFNRFEALVERPRLAEVPSSQADRETLRASRTLINVFNPAGAIYANHGRMFDAEKLWMKAASVDPTDLESRELLLQSYLVSSQNERAFAVLGELVLLQPKNVDYQSTLGKIAIRLRKLDAADQAFRTAIDLGLQDATIYSQLAEIQLVDRRNVPKAIRLAKLAVELQPTAKNYHVLATANWHAGDNLAASTALREAIRLEPENVEYRDTLAFLESNK